MSGTRVRRVGFRHGTDEELAALHAVEAPIEAERRPDRIPQPLDAYAEFARNLPEQFDDHTWLVEAADGTSIATAAWWSNSAGDASAAECDLFVRRDRRRQGIGSELLAIICDDALADSRSLLTWSTFDAAPSGEGFSRMLGAEPARVNRTSELLLDEVDWNQLSTWVDHSTGRRRDYQLDVIDGAYPPELRADAARFHHIMQTMPADDLRVGPAHITEDHVASVDQALVKSGRNRTAILVRSPDGTCVGGTEVTFEPWDPGVVLQQNTGIDPDHRGLGLAKWAKAEMLHRIRRDRPSAVRVRTGNAFSNAAMLAINNALGFKVISVRTEWQTSTAALASRLARRRR